MKNKLSFIILLLLGFPTFSFAQEAVDKAADQGVENTQSGLKDILSLELLFEYIGAGVVFLVGIFLAWILRNIVLQGIDRARGEYIRESTKILIGRVVFFAIIVTAGTVSLQLIGIDVWTVLAALGFGIGFALKDLIASFVAGVTILLQEKINIGDLVRVGRSEEKVFGRVIDITSRATHLQSFDGTEIIVPNSDMVSKPVTSFHANPFRRIQVAVQIDLGSDVEKARRLVLEVLENLEGVEPQPSPSVYATSFSAYAIDLSARFWVQSHSAWFETRSQAIRIINKTFRENGILIPYPIQSIEVNQLDPSEIEELNELNQKTPPQSTPENPENPSIQTNNTDTNPNEI